jgi:hypothetical protein
MGRPVTVQSVESIQKIVCYRYTTETVRGGCSLTTTFADGSYTSFFYCHKFDVSSAKLEDNVIFSKFIRRNSDQWPPSGCLPISGLTPTGVVFLVRLRLVGLPPTGADGLLAWGNTGPCQLPVRCQVSTRGHQAKSVPGSPGQPVPGVIWPG